MSRQTQQPRRDNDVFDSQLEAAVEEQPFIFSLMVEGGASDLRPAIRAPRLIKLKRMREVHDVDPYS